MTANAMQGDRERCLQAGMDSYLAKPINSEELYRVLDEYTSVPTTPDQDSWVWGGIALSTDELLSET